MGDTIRRMKSDTQRKMGTTKTSAPRKSDRLTQEIIKIREGNIISRLEATICSNEDCFTCNCGATAINYFTATAHPDQQQLDKLKNGEEVKCNCGRLFGRISHQSAGEHCFKCNEGTIQVKDNFLNEEVNELEKREKAAKKERLKNGQPCYGNQNARDLAIHKIASKKQGLEDGAQLMAKGKKQTVTVGCTYEINLGNLTLHELLNGDLIDDQTGQVKTKYTDQALKYKGGKAPARRKKDQLMLKCSNANCPSNKKNVFKLVDTFKEKSEGDKCHIGKCNMAARNPFNPVDNTLRMRKVKIPM